MKSYVSKRPGKTEVHLNVTLLLPPRIQPGGQSEHEKPVNRLASRFLLVAVAFLAIPAFIGLMMLFIRSFGR